MKKRRRTFTPRQRLQIVLEGMQGDATVADVCRRHQISSTMYYRWRDQLYENAERVFEKRGQSEHATALEQENRRLKEVIAEITAENLDLKKAWGLGDYATLSRELWPVIVAEVGRTRERMGGEPELGRAGHQSCDVLSTAPGRRGGPQATSTAGGGARCDT